MRQHLEYMDEWIQYQWIDHSFLMKQRRLAELQEKKRKANEELMRRQVVLQQQQERDRQLQEVREGLDLGAIRQVMEENMKLKEELQSLKGAAGERQTPVKDEFKTPENIPMEKRNSTSEGDPARKLDLDPKSQQDTGLPRGSQEGDPKGLQREPREGDPPTGDTMKFMMTMLEGMQKLMMSREGFKDPSAVEVVKNSIELPKLVEWSQETGPIDLGDWVATIEPFIEDLSDGAAEWWSLLWKEANEWYDRHQAMTPLERLSHEVVATEELAQAKWARLERRAAGMLMAAIPQSVREEVVSTRRVTVLGIITKLLVVYQPGGLAEKSLIFTSLESPKEETTLQGAVQALRRWIRWRRRAMDVKVSVPDPTVLMKGLSKMTKRILNSHQELAFRISLARNTLQVDSIPTHTSVEKIANHMLAEFEQVAHQDRKSKDMAPAGEVSKLKEFRPSEAAGEGGKGKGKDGKGKDAGKGSEKGPSGGAQGSGGEVKCRFYLTDAGCRKGRDCKFSHDQSDGKRRCYSCGSVDHYAPDCPRKSSSPTRDPQNKQKTAKNLEEGKEDTSKPPSEGGSGQSDGETMQQLLSEANKMLKTLSMKEKPVTVTHDERMRALQEQLDELKVKTLKTLKLTRITRGGVSGLLDSGATHPMRAAHRGEPAHSYKKVEVTLASGKTEELKMSPKGVMVLDGKDADYVEPIVPMGMLVTKLRCQLHWNDQGLHVWHPKRGYIDVTVQNGCPQIPKALALKLIQELEQAEGDLLQYHSKGLTWETRLQERAWLRSLVNSHPVFEGLPEALKDKLVVTPEEDVKMLPANRRARKIWKRDGCVLHLYAGEASGYTFARAYREAGGREKQVLEIDVKRGENHDMRRSSCYGSLMRLALDGQVSTLIGGPNCRTRSVLRMYDGGPPPVRSWGGGEFGIVNASEAEIKKVQHDDEMMWKMILLYLVANASRKALKKDDGRRASVGFLLEQPAPPEYKPEVVSFWWTSQWRSLQQLESLELLTVNQGDYGGDAVKPTGLGTNLDVAEGRLRGQGRARPMNGSGDSSSLARWAPGLMKAVAISVMNLLGIKPRLKAINWEQHLKQGHYPFHKDRRICQEAAAKDRPHRRLRHPKAGILSMDLAGPLRREPDHEAQKRYILVGAFTWIVPRGKTTDEKPPEVEEGAPVIDQDEALEEEQVLIEGLPPPEPEQASPGHHDVHDEEHRDKGQEGYEEEGNGGEDHEDFEVEVYRLAIPIEDRTAEKVLDAVIQMYLQLRADGFQIQQIHTDKAREFVAKGLVAWCKNRNIYKTTTSGDSPQQNGRAERAVQYVKARIRVLLLSASWSAARWPLACWNIHSMERLRRNQRKVTAPPFGTEVLVRKRYWKSKELEPTHERVHYVAPVPEVHGHLVVESNGAFRVAAYVMASTKEPPESEETWIAIKTEIEDREDEIEVRRRIRGKTAVKVLDVGEEPNDEETWKNSLQKVVEEESVRMVEDDEEVGVVLYRRLRSIKAAATDETAPEDVLRTRIVPIFEFLRDAEEWRPAVEAEMKQLFEEKKALIATNLNYVQQLKQVGKFVTVIPSKLVITLKPGPRRKVRIVACGNFIEFRGEELFASGADSAALRLLLKIASEGRWNLLTVDVKVAFLNAPLVTSRKDGSEEDQIYALKPPSLLLRLGYAKEDEVWIAEKAMYGLRQSPRSWSLHRDSTLVNLVIPGLKLRQTASEQNLWAIEDDEYQLVGLILVYVDDMLICGRGEVPEVVLRVLQDVWETSPPERIDEASTSKFLGMEITKVNGMLKATQTAFIKERLVINLGEGWETMKGHSTPCGREIIEIEEEQEIKPEEVKEAQRIVGELLWLVTRSRMDLMYVTARLAQHVLRAPRAVKRLSRQVWSYLRRTLHQGLLFLPDPGCGWAGEPRKGLEAFSDASFAPAGQHSIGSVIIQWNGSPMLWRAGKQPYLTMSAAEAELTEAVEAMTCGDSFEALIGELVKEYPKTLHIDNTAAIQLMAEENGSWRTRHLRLRSSHLRWRIARMDWRINHCPGERMLADIGTKPLAAQRFEELKVLCGMSDEKEEPRVGAERTPTTTSVPQEGLQQALRMIAMATLLTKAASEDAGEVNRDVNEEKIYSDDIKIYLVMILVGIGLGWVLKHRSWLRIEVKGTKWMMRLLVSTMVLRRVEAPNGEGNEDEDHARRENDGVMWMIVALYTFLIVVAVNTFQWVFSTWRTVAENVESGLEERRGATAYQRMRILAAQRSLREAERRRNEAEDALFQEIVQAYYPATPTSQRQRDSRSRSMLRSRSGRSSRRSDEESPSGRRSFTEENTPEEERRDTRSQSTRNYASRSEEGTPGERFNVFGRPDDEEDLDQGEERLHREEGERDGRGSNQAEEAQGTPDVPRAVDLPEYRGPGRYVEDASRGLRRRLDYQEGEDLQEAPEEEEPQHDSPFEDDEMSVRSDHEVQVLQEGEGVAQGPAQGRREDVGPDLQPDQEPEDEVPEDRREGEGQGPRRGDGPERHEGDVPPDPPGELPANEIWVTPMGTRYHLSRRCPTLASSRVIRRSEWCQYCARRERALVRPRVHIATLGDVAHVDRDCVMVGLRAPTTYPCCQVCPTPRGVWLLHYGLSYGIKGKTVEKTAFGYLPMVCWEAAACISQGGVQDVFSFCTAQIKKSTTRNMWHIRCMTYLLR